MTDEQKQELKSTFRSNYYNVVAACCFNVLSLNSTKKQVGDKLSTDEFKEIIEDAHEWFMIHFFDD